MWGAAARAATKPAAKREARRASAAHYSDAVSDGRAAPDIRAVDVTNAPDGRITFRVTLEEFTPRSKIGVDLWLDTDADSETGNTTFDDAGGAEYLLAAFVGIDRPADPYCGLIAAGGGCLSVWTDGGWSAAAAPTARVTRTHSGVTISINRSDLGNTDELSFYAVRPPPPGILDRAPGRGTFNYSLSHGGPRTDPSTARNETTDKAGGKSDRRPVVLTLASHDYSAVEASEFASAVNRFFRGLDPDRRQARLPVLRHRLRSGNHPGRPKRRRRPRARRRPPPRTPQG